MQNVMGLLNEYGQYILIGIAFIVLIQFILIIVLFNTTSKLEKKYRKLMRGANGKNIEELVISYLDKVDEVKEISRNMTKQNDLLNKKINKCVQKFSVIRYKAFADVGSDLSFSVALLDENNDGVILTGIYARYESTTYAKPIDKGISRYDLSEEELHVLNDAINK
ncbi:DUF4446 family protein [Clostridium tarantellae]|uniref:DUF4446 family protein n=1 Tax=Clostridium tarantellae TaxID=39493 RepID=A0A6I1MK62_9CLOT|nr:DUF4446 family protein [Clostridium tarantellae]MPQ43775.1 DUF4446 family protein [Clostridium tarantellae]